MSSDNRETNLAVVAKLELKLDRLLQAFESPFSLFAFQCRDAEELCDCLLGLGELLLLGVVVLVFDIDIASLLVIVFLVLEVVPELP